MTVAIRCEAVTAAYNGVRVLDGVGLEVGVGEWLAVVGPNGAGKTTLLRVLTGQLAAGGTIEVGGAELSRLKRRQVAAMVAVVPQTPVVPIGMRVFDYVLLGRTPYIPYWGSERGEDIERVRVVLRDLDLEAFADRPLSALSGGERQRVILARALAQDAAILVLDEPTTGLDLGHQHHVLELVDELRRDRGLAVVSALHDLTLAARYADRVALLAGGTVVCSGAPREVLDPARIESIFGVAVRILGGADGDVAVVPAPRRAPSREGRGDAT
jgi:iron complex transport system ATP-binding protein